MKQLLSLMILLQFALSIRAQSSVTWTEPSLNAAASMPIGNGEVGANVWMQPDGTLSFYVSRTDSWAGSGRLMKLGRVDISFTPNPVTNGDFVQCLNTADGVYEVKMPTCELKLFVDTESPVIYVSGKSKTKVHVKAATVSWRKETKTVKPGSAEMRGFWGLQDIPDSVGRIEEHADIILNKPNALATCYRNQNSLYPFTLQFQQLNVDAATSRDMYKDRTFGLYIPQANSFVKQNDTLLSTTAPVHAFDLKVIAYTAQCASTEAWYAQARQIGDRAKSEAKAFKQTKKWWNDYWKRSHIVVSTPDKVTGERITEAYNLQKWVSACAGRGNYPIKFNGSLFTVDAVHTDKDRDFGPDFRLWGECFWWQNTRLMYHPMLAAGNFDMMRPLFELYKKNMPVFKAISSDFYGVEGASIPETMLPFGTYSCRDYGWDRTGKTKGEVNNTYIRYMYNPNVELISLMLDYYNYTGDEVFAKETLIPMSKELLLYFDNRFGKDKSAALKITPTQSLETYWDGVINDLPTVSGLHASVSGLLSLPQGLLNEAEAAWLSNLQKRLPAIPSNDTTFLPAEIYDPKRSNVENPELYVMFPFRQCNFSTPDRAKGIKAFNARKIKGHQGWYQDGQQAAILGLTDEARDNILKKIDNKHPNHKFPVFWGPNFDWLPDQDIAGNYMQTLQDMVMQTYDGTVYLLPAFPKEWNVDFKLYTPAGCTVEGQWAKGQWQAQPKAKGRNKTNVTIQK